MGSTCLTEKQCMDAVAALAALLAKAEAAEENAREERKARKAVEAVKSEEVAIARTNWTARLEAAEAERDAAEEKNKKLSALIVEQERQYRAEREAAVRAAEQAQAALRQLTDAAGEDVDIGDEINRCRMCWVAWGKHDPDCAYAIARAALTGEGT